MAYVILPDCTVCGDCLTVCPNEAIRQAVDEARAVWIEPLLCTECVGYSESPECVAACPENAIRELDPAVFLAYWNGHRRHADSPGSP